MSRRVVVRVPGSSKVEAGAGAVDRWLTASFTLDGTGAPLVERGGTLRSLATSDDADVLIAGFAAACTAADVAMPDELHCRVVSEIPVGEGEGASAAAALAGVIGARALLALPLGDAAAGQIAAALDGSPQQVRAAMDRHTCAVYPVCDDTPTAV